MPQRSSQRALGCLTTWAGLASRRCAAAGLAGRGGRAPCSVPARGCQGVDTSPPAPVATAPAPAGSPPPTSGAQQQWFGARDLGHSEIQQGMEQALGLTVTALNSIKLCQTSTAWVFSPLASRASAWRSNAWRWPSLLNGSSCRWARCQGAAAGCSPAHTHPNPHSRPASLAALGQPRADGTKQLKGLA